MQYIFRSVATSQIPLFIDQFIRAWNNIVRKPLQIMRIKEKEKRVIGICQCRLISTEILDERLGYFFGSSPRTAFDIIIRHIHIEHITRRIQYGCLIFRIAFFDNVFNLRSQFRTLIIRQPFSQLPRIEIFNGKTLVLSHKIGQLFGRMGYLILSSIKNNAEATSALLS